MHQLLTLLGKYLKVPLLHVCISLVSCSHALFPFFSHPYCILEHAHLLLLLCLFSLRSRHQLFICMYCVDAVCLMAGMHFHSHCLFVWHFSPRLSSGEKVNKKYTCLSLCLSMFNMLSCLFQTCFIMSHY